MRNYKLTIEYDGSRYNGWQRLGNTENTIQFKIENVLSLMTGEEIKIIGSGRTDAGVHAFNQIANFKTYCTKSPLEIENYCNQYLPQDIVIKKVTEVDERFHARYNAVSKIYLYRIWNQQTPTAFKRKYSYHIPHQLDIQAMRQAANYFVGEHDFKAFSSAKSKKKSSVRTIYSINLNVNGPELDIYFHGNGFLYNMVRIMTGTLIEIGEHKQKPQNIEDILQERSREEAGVTAPAQALFLYDVFYE